MKLEATKSLGCLSALILYFGTAPVVAQTYEPDGAHSTQAVGNASAASTDTANLQQELARLRDHVRRLEQRMQAGAPMKVQQSGGMSSESKAAMAQPAQTGMKMAGMQMMDDDMDMPMGAPADGASMSAGSSRGMSMMDMMRSKMADDDVMGMGAMGSVAAMSPSSMLPGFPGQSHLYHIGATGFFLDHPQHISLTTQQQQMLARHKQDALLKHGDLQRQIDAADERLWQLTSADEPQIGNIEKQVREIERLRADQRIAFIRSVGEAAKALTDEQRKQLTGMAPGRSAAPMSTPDSNQREPDSMGHM